MSGRRAALVLLTAVWACAPVPADPGTWPSLRDGSDANATCTWPGPDPAPDIREWHFTHKGGRRYKMGLAVWASPALAIVQGRPMAFIGGYGQTLHALDLAAKERIWFKITNGEIGTAPAVGRADGRQVVYWGSADRWVYAHDAATGRRVWSRELVAPSPTMAAAQVSSPLLHEGTMYIACFVHDRALARNKQVARLYALDMATGEVRWSRVVSNGPVSSPVGRDLDNRFHLWIAARKGLLQCFDVSGERPVRRWTYQIAHEVFGSPAVEPDGDEPLLFLGSKFGNLNAINARTGQRVWNRMAGNWIDNTACLAAVDGERVVFVGSHDYKVYAFRARDGKELWSRPLGGEVYSAPCFFRESAGPAIAVSALDDHLYVLDARTGEIRTSYFTGRPIWDKVPKGETLWGSPVAFQAGDQTAVVHGSFNDTVYVLPLEGEVSLRAQARSSAELWWGLLVVLGLFLGVVLPVVLWWPGPARGQGAVRE